MIKIYILVAAELPCRPRNVRGHLYLYPQICDHTFRHTSSSGGNCGKRCEYPYRNKAACCQSLRSIRWRQDHLCLIYLAYTGARHTAGQCVLVTSCAPDANLKFTSTQDWHGSLSPLSMLQKQPQR